MANTVVVGTQWGDEGKAKIIDYLTRSADSSCGSRAARTPGHTVIAEGNKFVFHLVPSGIINPDKVCMVGNGVVFDAQQFLHEINELRTMGICVDGGSSSPTSPTSCSPSMASKTLRQSRTGSATR